MNKISEDLDDSEQLKIQSEQTKDELNQTIKKLTEQLNIKDIELNQTAAELEQTKNALNQATNKLAELINSKSWIITKPLRNLLKIFRKLYHKLYRNIRREKFKFKIEPINELTEINNDNHFNYQSSGNDPYFYLVPIKKRFPKGFVKICIKSKKCIFIKLYFG